MPWAFALPPGCPARPHSLNLPAPPTCLSVATCLPCLSSASQVAGMLRLVLSPIEEELPFLTGLQLSLLERPYLDFDIRWVAGWLAGWLDGWMAGWLAAVGVCGRWQAGRPEATKGPRCPAIYAIDNSD